MNFFSKLVGNRAFLTNSFLIVAMVLMFWVMSRAQRKKKEQEDTMRKGIKIGDEIITIGGIMGRVISVKNDNDSLVIESGTEKLRVRRWAVAQIQNAVHEASFKK